MSRLLNDAATPTPQAAHGRVSPDGWQPSTIGFILHNGMYWGEPTSMKDSKDGIPPQRIPAFGPTYVTPEEAARAHARQRTAKEYSPRNKKYEYGNLLPPGMARCAACGGALGVWLAGWAYLPLHPGESPMDAQNTPVAIHDVTS